MAARIRFENRTSFHANPFVGREMAVAIRQGYLSPKGGIGQSTRLLRERFAERFFCVCVEHLRKALDRDLVSRWGDRRLSRVAYIIRNALQYGCVRGVGLGKTSSLDPWHGHKSSE